MSRPHAKTSRDSAHAGCLVEFLEAFHDWTRAVSAFLERNSSHWWRAALLLVSCSAARDSSLAPRMRATDLGNARWLVHRICAPAMYKSLLPSTSSFITIKSSVLSAYLLSSSTPGLLLNIGLSNIVLNPSEQPPTCLSSGAARS